MCIQTAARVISQSDCLWIGAGAGIGVDSGLPDFRGDEGFWKAYPPLKRLGLTFYDMANPQSFHGDPTRAWGFYGHRLQRYRSTRPHQGFQTLRSWCQELGKDSFVFTSNVDGHFQSAGFCEENIVECHGTIHRLQCSRPCNPNTWSCRGTQVHVKMDEFRAVPPLPSCPCCDSIARPNILMFQDDQWISNDCREQLDRYEQWLTSHGNSRMSVIEIGAGTAVPTVRIEAERLAAFPNATLIRINPRESQCGSGDLSIDRTAMEAIQLLDPLIR